MVHAVAIHPTNQQPAENIGGLRWGMIWRGATVYLRRDDAGMLVGCGMVQVFSTIVPAGKVTSATQ